MPLLERESSLASLIEYAGEARQGQGRLVLVAGEAGVGKSALVEWLHSVLSDARWSWGACDGLFTPRPLGPLFDLADQFGGELLDMCRDHAARDDLFRALLRQVNEPGILNAVVIEDIHWADEATVDLLRFLGRRLRNTAALVIATYRDDGLSAGDPLRLALGELATQRSTRRVGLAPLTVDAVRVLAEGSGLEATELYRLTGGNPFYVTEVVQAGITSVPPSARDAVLARVGRLSDDARRVLDVAALIGTRIELSLLAAVTASSPAALDELVASGLLVGDGGWLRFRHEIARLAVEQAIAGHRRVPIHAGILDALHSLGSDDDAGMAFHAEAAGDAPATRHHAHRAAERAAELASHREAAAQYERALRFCSGENPTLVSDLHCGYAWELSLVDRWQEAAETYERALALSRLAGDRLREGDTLRRLSRAMWRLCRGPEAIAAAEAAVATLEALGPTTELAWAYVTVASFRMFAGDHDGASDLARRTQELAEALGLPDVLSEALNTEGCANADAGRDWIDQLRRALDIALSERLEAQAGRAYTNLYTNFCEKRRYAEAEHYYVEGLAYCDEHDITTYASCLRGERTSTLERIGRWDESTAIGLDLLKLSSSPINRISPLANLGKVRARRAEDGVWECLDEAAEAADGTGEPQWIVPVRLARAEACWLEGRSTQTERELMLADDASAGSGAWLRGEIAVWLRRISGPPLSGDSDDVAEPYRLQLSGAWEAAVQAWFALGCPYDAAMALLDANLEEPLRQALSVFSDLGASAAVRVARQRMRRLGLRSIPNGAQTATRAHPLGLTRREGEVLNFICSGHTNAEIAARLVISTKTVDHHVSAVLAKLGAPTRSIAAAEAIRLGLVSPVSHL